MGLGLDVWGQAEAHVAGWQAKLLVWDSNLILDQEGRIPEGLTFAQPWPSTSSLEPTPPEEAV